jgi:protein-S-isoprenylcysteine O-methyltransferase Ste14
MYDSLVSMKTELSIWVFIFFYGVNLVIRFIYTAGLRNTRDVSFHKKDLVELVLLNISGFGMRLIPFVYILTSWLDKYNYLTPGWFLYAGIFLSVISTVLLYLAHRTLNNNWSLSLQIRNNQTLVTSGIYKYIRHPMYLSILVWCLSLVFLLHNYLACLLPLILFVALIISRLPKEEKMMMEKFNGLYAEHKRKSFRLIPFIY